MILEIEKKIFSCTSNYMYKHMADNDVPGAWPFNMDPRKEMAGFISRIRPKLKKKFV